MYQSVSRLPTDFLAFENVPRVDTGLVMLDQQDQALGATTVGRASEPILDGGGREPMVVVDCQ